MHDGTLVIQKLNLRRLTVGFVFQKAVGRLREKTFKGIDLQVQLGPLVQSAGTVDGHMALRFQVVARLRIVHAVGAQNGVAPPKHHRAFQQDILIWLADQPVRLDKRRQLGPHILRNFFLQQTAGLEHHGRCGRRALQWLRQSRQGRAKHQDEQSFQKQRSVRMRQVVGASGWRPALCRI